LDLITIRVGSNTGYDRRGIPHRNYHKICSAHTNVLSKEEAHLSDMSKSSRTRWS
jgi:hypothetical protein